MHEFMRNEIDELVMVKFVMDGVLHRGKRIGCWQRSCMAEPFVLGIYHRERVYISDHISKRSSALCRSNVLHQTLGVDCAA